MNEPPKEKDASKVRTFDKVYAYLDQHLKVGEKKANFRLPPIRQISRGTGVSPSSVRNVLLNLAEEGRVEIFPGSGAFWIPNPSRKREELVIGINSFVAPGHEATAQRLWSSLYGGMIRAAVKESLEVKFKPVAFDLASPQAVDFGNLSHTVKGADCFFFSYPSPMARHIVAFLEELAIPCIFYNPISPTETVNFLSPDYFGTARRIGRIWARTGRERILLLQAPGAQRSTSCQLLYAGLTTGLGMERAVLPEVRRLDIRENSRSLAAGAFKALVKEQKRPPDAVHCTADESALGVRDAAYELGIEIPRQMSIIGGNGMSRHEEEGLLPLLTATEQPVGQIGENFIRLFQKRSANQMREVPGLYFPMKVLIGQTTREEENELLAGDRLA
ncbi:MAG TPA: substrate-binding domain-containing protein [Chthoniobacteraceae bacterium]|nr:substrate-binding domain-containing protein [Chthoniobacteraceae bacterium]